MTSGGSHVCEETPSGSRCTVIGDYSFVNVSMGDVALTRSGFCRSLDATVGVECEVEQIRRHCRRCRKWSRK